MTGPSRPLVLLVLVAAAAVAGWGGALAYGWVYDDHRFAEGNPSLDAVAREPWRAFDPATAGRDGAEPGLWRPLRTLSFAADRALFGADPRGAHGANLLLHGTAAALVFALGLSLGLGDLAAAAGAALWALHPVQAEAVCWISSRGDLLASVLLLAAGVLHVRRRSAAAEAICVGLAFLAKESALAAPAILLVLDLAAGGMEGVRAGRGRTAAALGVLAVLAGIRAAVLAGAGSTVGQGSGVFGGPGEALLAQPALGAWYASRVLLPSPGTFDLQFAPTVAWALGGLSLAALLALAGRAGSPGSLVAAGALGAAAALLPVTLVQVAFPLKILVADRFLHLALAGPALAAGAWAGSRGEGPARGLLAAAPLLLLASFPAAERWRSDEALWRDVLAREERHPRALHGLAAALEERDPEESRRLYRAYADAVPDDPVGWFRLGLLEERGALAASDGATRQGRLLLAAEALGNAVRLWDAGGGEPGARARGFAEARYARATVLAALGRPGPAETEARAAHALGAAEPADRRERHRPRVDLLLRWAREKDRKELAALLEGGPR